LEWVHEDLSEIGKIGITKLGDLIYKILLQLQKDTGSRVVNYPQIFLQWQTRLVLGQVHGVQCIILTLQLRPFQPSKTSFHLLRFEGLTLKYPAIESKSARK
jgi:hypothetical protein